MGRTSVEWTTWTWNPFVAYRLDTGQRGWFCQRVSGECKNCYAAAMNRFRGNRYDYTADNAAKVRVDLHARTLSQPLQWRKPRPCFVCSMTDLFYEQHSFDMIDQVFKIMATVKGRGHVFQVLTKRIERALEWTFSRTTRREYVEANPHIWFGVTAGDPRFASQRINQLGLMPATTRFLSLEPLLGEINLAPHIFAGRRHRRPLFHWVIVGGESGRKATATHPKWVTAIRDQCLAAEIPFFFKQWGEFGPKKPLTESTGPSRRGVFRFPDGTEMYRVGKKHAGRKLESREWNQVPPTLYQTLEGSYRQANQL